MYTRRRRYCPYETANEGNAHSGRANICISRWTKINRSIMMNAPQVWNCVCALLNVLRFWSGSIDVFAMCSHRPIAFLVSYFRYRCRLRIDASLDWQKNRTQITIHPSWKNSELHYRNIVLSTPSHVRSVPS